MTFAQVTREPPEVDDDEDDFLRPPVQRVVPASSEPAPATRAPVSIFTVAKVLRVCKQRRKARGGDLVRGEPTKVLETSEAGVTRVVGRGYPSDRWTAQKEQQELDRRARQKPPKPTRKAKTRSKKLLDLIGDESDT